MANRLCAGVSSYDEIAESYFKEFFSKGIFVGQLRTRLGIEGWERKGPEA